jgi:hypothetical protein
VVPNIPISPFNSPNAQMDMYTIAMKNKIGREFSPKSFAKSNPGTIKRKKIL